MTPVFYPPAAAFDRRNKSSRLTVEYRLTSMAAGIPFQVKATKAPGRFSGLEILHDTPFKVSGAPVGRINRQERRSRGLAVGPKVGT